MEIEIMIFLGVEIMILLGFHSYFLVIYATQ